MGVIIVQYLEESLRRIESNHCAGSRGIIAQDFGDEDLPVCSEEYSMYALSHKSETTEVRDRCHKKDTQSIGFDLRLNPNISGKGAALRKEEITEQEMLWFEQACSAHTTQNIAYCSKLQHSSNRRSF